jgi:Ser/Thr protein kinase RdoA (MazF antagonist)
LPVRTPRVTCLSDDLQSLLHRTLGPAQLVADLSWDHGESLVLLILTEDGRRAVVKSHREDRKFRTELAAYRSVVTALGDGAPRLLGYDLHQKALVLSYLPGSPVDRLSEATSARIHAQAGRLLRSLHDAMEPVPLTDWHRRLSERLRRWLARSGARILGTDEVARAWSEVHRVAHLEPLGVFTHCDWQPRNWLLDRPALRAIDFEHSRWEVWVVDVQKLWWGSWRDRPDLRDAFLSAYDPNGDRTLEPAPFRAIAAVHLVSTVVWATEHDDPAYAAEARRGLRVLQETESAPHALFEPAAGSGVVIGSTSQARDDHPGGSA